MTKLRFLQKPVVRYDQLFQFRSVWMALAILWVILVHSPIDSGPFLFIQLLGYGGVDIFLFASGLGCYFSLSRERNAKNFLRSRARKILPMWFFFLFFFFLYKSLTDSIRFSEILGNLFGLGTLAGAKNQFNWYILAMWAFYMLAPVFYDVVRNSGVLHKASVIFFLFLFSTLFWNQYLLLFWSRFPVFYLGMAFADHSSQKPFLSGKGLILVFTAMAVGMLMLAISFFCFMEDLWNYGLYWYPFILVTPGLVFTISFVCQWLTRTPVRLLISLLSRLGENSFPLYISHIFIFDVVDHLARQGRFSQGLSSYLISLMLTVVFAVVLRFGANLLTALLFRPRKTPPVPGQ